jgi:hypothetical protein
VGITKIQLTMPRVMMSRADRNPWLAKMVCCVARTSEITHNTIHWRCTCLDGNFWYFNILNQYL